jgi:hypothetical protein
MGYFRHNINACHSVLLDNCDGIKSFSICIDNDPLLDRIISIEFGYFVPIL